MEFSVQNEADITPRSQSLQPVPQSLISDLEQNQDEAYWRLYRLSRKQWQQQDAVHGNDIFYHLMQSHSKALKWMNEVVDLCFQECRANQMRSRTATTRSVSIKYPQITQIDLRARKDFDAAVSDFQQQIPDLQLSRPTAVPQQDPVGDESQVLSAYSGIILKLIALCCNQLSDHKDYQYFGSTCAFLPKSGTYALGDPDQVWVSARDKGLQNLPSN
ncbi:hypothetical protein MIR68_012130 [Amoeboaphelidium protococcarum]|nr:hypothetical protein MIR68_012130 [Amoeboaphelidium protococcarum]